MRDCECVSLLLDVSSLCLKRLEDVRVEVEVRDLHVLELVVHCVEDVELHVVEGDEEGLDELRLEAEEDGELCLHHLVVVVVLLLGDLHLCLGLVHALLVLGGGLLLLLVLGVVVEASVEVELLVVTLGGHLADVSDNLEQLLAGLDDLLLDELQVRLEGVL